MIRNFIKTAFRSLLKNKGFTFINILGLALGLATCLLIVFYVVDELSYDRYNTKYDRIYRINTDLKYGETVSSFALVAPPVGDALVSNFPEVLKTARLSVAMNIRFKKGNENLVEDKVLYCDKSILEIFTMPMLAGDTHTALNDPTSIVISQSAAKRYFGNTAAVGQTLMMVGDSSVHNVTGVMRDIPSQSHFRADFLIPLAPNTDHSWSHFNTNTYILLKPGADHKKLEAKFDGLMRRNINTADFDYDKFSSKGNYIRMNLTPLTDIHLKSNRQRELAPNGNIEYVYIFSAIALFILLLACINFMNLSTARSANRAREVGVRKVLGSSRKYLIAQFLSESVLVTFTAIVIAALAAWALLPLFNDIAGKQIVIRLQTFVWLLPMLLLITVVVSVLAGSYPAFFLSAFQPIHVLKGKISTGFKGGALRSFLVVTQFAISIFLIIGTLVIYNQLNYIQNKNLGFERDRVIVIKNAQVLHDPKILKNELKQLSGISNATLSSYLPTGTNRWTNSISKEHKGGMFAEYWPVDEDYISTMGMSLVKGRNFSSQLSTDSLGIIINQTTASMLGFANDPINQTIYNGQGEHARKYHVIGVVKDFNFSSLRDNVTPLVMVMANDWMASLNVKASTSNLPALLKQIEGKWKSIAPNEPFNYSFMDEDFNAMYRSEQRIGQLFIIFTSLAIIIACLGLFGLAAYAAEQRNRELGIRKVLGAGVSTLVAMLSKDFIRLVIIAIVIAAPLAWLVMQKWLQGFAYRQNIQWWVFAAAGAGALVIAFITVSFQSINAALVNPVESLRSE